MPVQGKQYDSVPGIRIDTNAPYHANLISDADSTKIYCDQKLGCSFSNPLQPALDGKYLRIVDADVVFAHPTPEHDAVQVVVEAPSAPRAHPLPNEDRTMNMQLFGVICTLLAVPGLLWLGRCIYIYLL